MYTIHIQCDRINPPQLVIMMITSQCTISSLPPVPIQLSSFHYFHVTLLKWRRLALWTSRSLNNVYHRQCNGLLGTKFSKKTRTDIFRSARTSCTTFGWIVQCTPVRKKNLDHNIYRHTCLMNNQKSHQTNPMAQRDPIDAPLTPWDPVGLPLDPLGPCRPTPWPPETL